jgi:hypothetical protein
MFDSARRIALSAASASGLPSAAAIGAKARAAASGSSAKRPASRVSPGRLGPAAPVAGRPRVGAGAARADAQHVAVVAPHDRSAARADGDDVDHRQQDRQAIDLAAAREHRPAVAHERHVRRGAADVEHDDVAEAGARSMAQRARDARGGPREQGRRRVAPHGGEGDAPAARLHHRQAAREAHARESRLDAAEVAVDHRLHEGSDGGRGGALVLAELAGHLVRAGDRETGNLGAQQRRERRLVDRVGEAVEQADRDRVVAAVAQEPQQRRREGSDIERALDAAVAADPLGDLQRVAARGQRFGLGVEEVEDPPAVVALQQQDVAETLGREEGEPRALALEHRVGRHGRAMDEFRDGRDWHPGRRERREGSLLRCQPHARHLGDRRARPHGHEIREGPAYLDSNPRHEIPRFPARL